VRGYNRRGSAGRSGVIGPNEVTLAGNDPQQRILMAAFAISVGVHASVLAVRFVDENYLRVRSSEPALEVVLVNSRSQARPVRPDAIAQANLDGGGPNEAGRRTSPLPPSARMRDGDTLEQARRAVAQLEVEQKQLLSAFAANLRAVAPVPEPRRLAEGADRDPARETLERMQAEIARDISDYQKRPRTHHFMPSTSESRYARYVEDWREKVERTGNDHYPDEARGRIYGSLRMTVSIRRDGSLVDAIVEQSSGSQVLDRAARRNVKLSAPFPPFPPDVARATDVLEITRTWLFTNDQFATRTQSAEARP
jgi:protein TonB